MSQPMAKKKNQTRRGKGAKVTRKPKVVVVQQQRSPKRSRKQGQKKKRFQTNQLTGRGTVKNSTTNRQRMVIEEDEYVGEIVGGAGTPSAFNVQAFPVNIGQAVTFPWGSGVCKNNFEKYEFEYLEFYVKREVSEFAASGTTGKVMLMFDNDASDGPPTTKQQVEDTDPHADGMPCENVRLVIPSRMLKACCDDGHFVRPAGLPGGADIKTYDVGNLFVCTQGLAVTNATVGELHVRYRVRAKIPILEAGAAAPANNSVTFLTLVGGINPTSAVPITLPFDTVITNGLAVVNAAGALTLPVGNYIVTAEVQSSQSNSQTNIALSLQKNGVPIGLDIQEGLYNAVANYMTLTHEVFYSSNGTDILTAVAQLNFGSGVPFLRGSIIITAI